MRKLSAEIAVFGVFACGCLLLSPRASGQGAEPTLSWTRHGEVVFEADVRPGGAAKNSRPMLVESMEISGVRKKEGWGEFAAAFFDATSRAWLRTIPAAAGASKGKVVVEFAVRGDGTLEAAPVVEKSSGDASIDAATREAIAKSAPFRRLPAKHDRAAARLRVTFEYENPHVPASGGPR
ncbi:MAG TPA: TonB family protein [Candidatus Acidoferrales bacterium]|nr:TonB family protein [Candidatus Acidoferrales bacterium]